MVTQPYDNLPPGATFRELLAFCRETTRLRQDDINAFANLSNIFMRGRKVGKIPSSSGDTDVTDRVGDFNYDANYLYLCVDNSGATWRRIGFRKLVAYGIF